MNNGDIKAQVAMWRQLLESLLYEVKKIIVGQDHLLERMLIALIARGHLLVEGVPGLAKTLAVKTLAATIGGQFKRVQFTPDLMPADLIGTRIYNQKNGDFEIVLGPVFANLLLADEINRAPAKVQSALLEVMQERQVTLAGETYKLPSPFFVMATQNPIESEGTYALPEAQVDRFMMKVVVGYPSPSEESAIIERGLGDAETIGQVLDTESLTRIQHIAREVYVDPAIVEYIVRIVNTTRNPSAHGAGDLTRYIQFGVGPRGSLNMALAARALALLRGRLYVLPQDVSDIAIDVMRHRLILTYEAIAEGVSPDRIAQRVLELVRPPSGDLIYNHARDKARV